MLALSSGVRPISFDLKFSNGFWVRVIQSIGVGFWPKGKKFMTNANSICNFMLLVLYYSKG